MADQYEQVTSDDVTQLAQKYGIPPELALAFFNQESSGGKNTGTSSKGAVGPLQVTKGTFDAMNVGTDINDPMQATEAGIKYLAQAYKKDPRPQAVAAYYHAGPNWQQKLQDNPNLGDGSIRTVDYANQVTQKYRQLLAAKNNSATAVPVSYTPSDSASDLTVQTSDITAPAQTATGDFSSLGTEKYPFPEGSMVVEAKKPPDLNAVDSQIEGLMKSASDIGSSIVTSSADLSAKLKANLQEQSASLEREGDLSAMVGLEHFRQDSQRAAENASVLSKLGVNTSDTDGLVAQIATQMQDARQRLLDLNDTIQAKKSSSLLDDPIGFFSDRLTVGDDIKEFNRVARGYNINEEFINNATEEAAKLEAVNAAKYAPTTLKGAQAAADLQREIANQKKLEIDDKLSRIDLDSQVRTLQAITSRINTLDAYERAVTNKQIREDADAEKQRKAEQAQLEDQRTQIAGRVLGLDINGVNDLKRQRPDVKAAVSRIIANGGDESGKVAASPLEAEQILSTGNPAKMPPAAQFMSKLLTSARKKAEQEVAADPTVQAGNKAATVTAINQRMFTSLNDFIQHPHKGLMYDGLAGMSNPFEAPSLEVMSADPNAQNLKLVGILKDFKKTAPSVPLTDSLIAQLAFQNVGKQYKNISEAAKDVSDYYKAAVVRNNQTFKFSNFGLPDQVAYMGDASTNLASYPNVLKKMLDLQNFMLNGSYISGDFGTAGAILASKMKQILGSGSQTPTVPEGGQ